MGKFARAFNVIITIRLNGAVQTPISLSSATFNRGLTKEEVPEVGKEVPSVDGINGLKVLTLDANAKRAIYDLADAQERKNSALGNDDVLIDATFSIKVDAGPPIKYIMPDCTFDENTDTIGGSTERITQSASLTSETARRVQ